MGAGRGRLCRGYLRCRTAGRGRRALLLLGRAAVQESCQRDRLAATTTATLAFLLRETSWPLARAKQPPPVETLTELAHNASVHERRAMEAEREAVAMYRAYLMRDQVGQRFEDTVSAVTSFGAFVELEEPFVEGLIKLESLGNEQFVHDEIHMRLTGKKTGRMIELGDKVMVEINNVSVVRRRIDFTLIAVATQKRVKTPVGDGETRAGITQRKKAGREVDRAVRAHVERGAPPRKAAGAGGKLRLGVSYRGMRERDNDGGGGTRRGKPKPKKRR